MAKAKENIQKTMKITDEKLKLKTYIVSNSITPADIVLFFNFRSVQR
jgi:hypothetical protein